MGDFDQAEGGKFAPPTDMFDARLSKVHRAVVAAVKRELIAHNVTHAELMSAGLWLASLQPREIMAIGLVYLESAVMKHESEGKDGTIRAVMGPYHLDSHPELSRPYQMPRRPDEPGTPFLLNLEFKDTEGNALPGVRVDLWHSSNDGSYSGFTGGAAPPNLRGIMTSDENGEVSVGTIRPVPYLAVPPGHPISELLYRVGDHPWRPAHFHFRIDKEGFEPLVAQIYFEGDPIIEGPGDTADSVASSQVIKVGEGNDVELAATYGLTTPYQTGSYTFVLRRLS